MPLTLISPETGAVNGDQLIFPSKCGFCFCFADSDLITDPGTNAELTIYLPSQPTNNQNFEFQGQTFTYKTTATLPWEIQIGASTAFTLTATANAMATHATMNAADYLILPLFGFIIVSANKIGADYTVTFTDGTSPLTLISNVAGATPTLLANDYRVFVELLVSTTDNPLQWEIEKGFVVVPNIQADPVTGEWSATMCIPVDRLIDSHISRTVPDLVDPSLDLTTLHYDWLVQVVPRFARFYGGNSYPWYDKADPVNFTDMLCPDTLDYELWSPQNTTDELLMMLTRRTNLSYCRDIRLFLYCAVKAGTTYTVEVEWNDGIGWIGASDTTAPVRDCILEIRPHQLYPSGFEGQVSVQVKKSGNDYEKVYFTLSGACCNQTTFYFVNRFGKYEVIQCHAEATSGIEVDASQYTTCATCGQEQEIIEYSSTYTEIGSCFTEKFNLRQEEDLDFIRDFFTSTDVRLLLPDGSLERVLLERGTTAIRQGAALHRASFEVKYKRQPKRGN